MGYQYKGFTFVYSIKLSTGDMLQILMLPSLSSKKSTEITLEQNNLLFCTIVSYISPNNKPCWTDGISVIGISSLKTKLSKTSPVTKIQNLITRFEIENSGPVILCKSWLNHHITYPNWDCNMMGLLTLYTFNIHGLIHV